MNHFRPQPDDYICIVFKVMTLRGIPHHLSQSCEQVLLYSDFLTDSKHIDYSIDMDLVAELRSYLGILTKLPEDAADEVETILL